MSKEEILKDLLEQINSNYKDIDTEGNQIVTLYLEDAKEIVEMMNEFALLKQSVLNMNSLR